MEGAEHRNSRSQRKWSAPDRTGHFLGGIGSKLNWFKNGPGGNNELRSQYSGAVSSFDAARSEMVGSRTYSTNREGLNTVYVQCDTLAHTWARIYIWPQTGVITLPHLKMRYNLTFVVLFALLLVSIMSQINSLVHCIVSVWPVLYIPPVMLPIMLYPP